MSKDKESISSRITERIRQEFAPLRISFATAVKLSPVFFSLLTTKETRIIAQQHMIPGLEGTGAQPELILNRPVKKEKIRKQKKIRVTKGKECPNCHEVHPRFEDC